VDGERGMGGGCVCGGIQGEGVRVGRGVGGRDVEVELSHSLGTSEVERVELTGCDGTVGRDGGKQWVLRGQRRVGREGWCGE
jgi:hypothetical protein